MEQEKPKSETISKLMIDRVDDFKFHVAYLAYSKAWDENASEDARKTLNEIISSLNNEGSYFNFYKELNQYRNSGDTDFHYRSRIQTQKKGEWRRGEAKKFRNIRYKK